jgi:hypothetical protein
VVKLTVVSEPDKGAHRAARTEGEAVRRLLETQGFVTKIKNKEVVCPCPFHEEPGEIAPRKTPNFYVNAETGLWNCLSASCGERGNLRALEHHFNIGGDDEWVTAFVSREEKLKQYVNDLNRTEFSDRRSVFYRQGLTDDTIDRFRLGYDADKKRWVIPYLEGRKPKFFRYYQPDGDPRWKYTWEDGAHSCLYNEQDAIGDKEGLTILTEGECFEGDTEVFTSRGWVRFDDLVNHAENGNEDILVGQVTADGGIEFVTPSAYVKKPHVGDIIEHYVPHSRLSPMMSHRSTPDHRIPAIHHENLNPAFSDTETGRWLPRPVLNSKYEFSDAESGHGHHYAWPRSVILDGPGLNDDKMLKHFHHLVQEEEDFPESWLMEASLDERLAILRKAATLPNHCFTLTQQEWLGTLAHTTGCVAEHHIEPHWMAYRSSITVRYEAEKVTSWADMKTNVYMFEGTVYCVTVPSGMLLVRTDGTITVSGNCKTMLLTQLGWAAVGVPGASQWKSEWHESFSDARQIAIVFDNDNPLFHIYDNMETGHRCAKCASAGLSECVGHNPGQEAAVKRLKQLGWRAKNILLPLPNDDTRKTDINEYFIRDGFTNADFGELVTGRSASPFKVTSLRELHDSPPDEAIFLVEHGILPAGGRLLISGRPKIGKSIFVANLVLSLASGIPFLKSGQFPGFKVARPTRVLLLDRELSKYSLYSRLVSLIEDRPGYGAAAENLMIDHDHLFQLDSPEAYRLLEGLITHNGIEVILFDTAYKFFGGDIDSSKSIMKGFEVLDRLIAKTGVSVVLTHHHRKSQISGGKDIIDTDSIAGSFLWSGWPNASVLLNFLNRSVEDPFNSVCTFAAFRDAPPPDPIALYRGRESISYRNIELYQGEVEFNSREAVMALTTESIQQLLLDLCPVTEERFLHVAAARMQVQVKTVKAFLVDAMSRGGFVKKGNPVTYYIDGTERDDEDGNIKEIENIHFLFPEQRKD